MPKRNDINKILIIGSGPVIIGQACEFDYSGTQACKALRGIGYKIVLVNSNPATIMTDPEMADITYIEPLNPIVLARIIEKEQPDALLPNLGGQFALNLSVQLSDAGILEKYNVTVIGTTVDAIKQSEDRDALRQTMARLGIEMPMSRTANTVQDAEAAAEKLGYPVVIHPAYIMGGTGGGLVYNREELRAIAARGLAASMVHQVLVEESVLGWEELELEVVRDAKNQKVTVCFIENVDAMGVHTGDSFCTIPMLTIDKKLQHRLQQYAFDIVEAIEVIGSINFQFAHDPRTGRVVVIEINPRASRSSALASKATGFPIALTASLLAVGLTLDEIPCWRDGTLDKYTPSGDYVAVKFPRWAFDKFKDVEDVLGTRMRSTGEVMAIGKTYKEALQKAIRSLEINRYGLGFAKNFNDRSMDDLMDMLNRPGSERLFIIYEALRKGADIQDISKKTHIKTWWIEQMKQLVDLEEEIMSYRGQPLPDNLLIQSKKDGFADKYLARLLELPESNIREKRLSLGLGQAWEPVPVSGVENMAYHYSTYNAPNRVPVSNRQKIMVLGSGPNRIGQGIEFDYCCVHAALAIRNAGYEAIMVNCNPETVSTDYDTSNKLYFEPLTVEDVLSIYEKENPEGVIIQFGGQTPLDIADELARAGVRILGTPPEMINIAENRDRFRNIMRKLGIPKPQSGMAANIEQALTIADKIGYPLMIRSSCAPGGRAMEVVHDQGMLKRYMAAAVDVSPARPILIDKFLDNAIEAEADALSDGKAVFVPAVMEHIELAGIHSGDSACVIPPVSIPHKHIETITEYAKAIATELNVVGLMNIQCAIYNNTVYIIEANPMASRTVPLVSKVCHIPMARLATRLMLGEKIEAMNLHHKKIPYFGVKEAVFPFNMFPEVDPLLGPEMRSTGEVLGLAHSFGRAFFKSQEAVQLPLPLEGSVLFTIADRDKYPALEPVRLFRDLGFKIVATRGTYEFLDEQGIDCEPVKKLDYGRPNLIDAIKNGEIQLVINTPSGRQSRHDGSYIRKSAIQHNVLNITTTAAAVAAAKGIAARKHGSGKVRSLQAYHADLTD